MSGNFTVNEKNHLVKYFKLKGVIMIKIPWRITIILVLIGVVGGWYVALSSGLNLSGAEIVQAEIGIFACAGALVSATWLIAFFFKQTELLLKTNDLNY